MNKKVAASIFLTLFSLTVAQPVAAFNPIEAEKRVRERIEQLERERIQTAGSASEVQNQNLERARERIIQGIDRAIAHLNQRKEKITSMKIVDQGWRDEAIGEINQQIEWLEEKKAELQGAESFDQLRQTAQEVRNYWRRQRLIVKRFVGRILASRVNWVISRAERLHQRLEGIVDRAETEGKDVSQARDALSDLKAKLGSAKEQVELALEKFRAITDPDSANQLFQEGVRHLQEAHRYLSQFKQEMREVVRALKS